MNTNYLLIRRSSPANNMPCSPSPLSLFQLLRPRPSHSGAPVELLLISPRIPQREFFVIAVMRVNEVRTQSVVAIVFTAVQPRVFASFQIFEGDRPVHSAFPIHHLLIAVLIPDSLKLIVIFKSEETARLAIQPSLSVRVERRAPCDVPFSNRHCASPSVCRQSRWIRFAVTGEVQSELAK
jgi:hypothetical protein